MLVVPLRRARRRRPRRRGTSPAPSARLLADLVTLTKPRIISLLLVTTVAPMFITPAGLPSLSPVLWVLLGGYLMAGGANAINMWFDRDIDTRMSRTRLRPIPAGRITPPASGWRSAWRSGCAAFAVFWYRVNPLSAWLALGGLLFYVFIYTIWLKRSSPQNIVIGGAAGAFPPLVGWAAMTGRLDLAAIYLFAIIFYWTPPHFWALALIKQARLRPGRHPDDAGGARRGADQVRDASPPEPRSLPCPWCLRAVAGVTPRRWHGDMTDIVDQR